MSPHKAGRPFLDSGRSTRYGQLRCNYMPGQPVDAIADDREPAAWRESAFLAACRLALLA
jgi:hypothetical protein